MSLPRVVVEPQYVCGDREKNVAGAEARIDPNSLKPMIACGLEIAPRLRFQGRRPGTNGVKRTRRDVQPRDHPFCVPG